MQDANLPYPRLCTAYRELVQVIRRLYQKCRLVHADLSEYNILVHQVCDGHIVCGGFYVAEGYPIVVVTTLFCQLCILWLDQGWDHIALTMVVSISFAVVIVVGS